MEQAPTIPRNYRTGLNPGVQSIAAQVPADVFEILYGGARGGGKSYLGRYWLVDPDYITNAHYRGLVLRKDAVDLADWIDHADQQWRAYGLRFHFNAMRNEFVFASGAKIICGHMHTDNAYTKYQGNEYQKILFEEATQIPSMELYNMIRSSCRSAYAELKPQIMLTANPGGIGHCVPFGDVLTEKGWCPIQDIHVGDKVATLDEKNELSYVRVDQTIKEYYTGKLNTSDNWSARYTCTPNHKLAIQTETKNATGRVFHDISLRESSKLSSVSRLPKLGTWHGEEVPCFTVPPVPTRKPKVYNPDTITGDQYMAFMGWYLSEGCTIPRDKGFQIAQMKPQNRPIIEKLLQDCGFTYHKDTSGFTVYSPKWYEYLKQFGHAREKHVPREILSATPRQLQIFYDAIMLGDGHYHSYYTTSKQLCDDMQEIGLKLSLRTYFSKRRRPNRAGWSYQISFKANKLGWLERSKTHTEDFSGDVYCLGIDKLHRFYLRQNGTVFLSGNSWVKAYFVEPSPPMHIIAQPVDVAGKTIERKRIYIPATVDDNPHLIDADPMYVANTLEPLKESNPALYKAWRFGDWDVFMGQAFAEWRQTRDGRPWHVIRALPPEVHLEQCQIYIGFDWGWRDPTSFHWVAITPEDIVGTRHVYCYREMTGNETTPETWAQLLADVIATEPITALVMPHDAYYNKNDTNTIESRFEREFQRLKATRYPTLRVPMQFAESGTYENRIGRQTLLHELLATAPDGRPYLQIMDSCRNLIRTLPMLPYSQTKPETVEDKPGTPDHWYDSLTYALYYANLQTSLRGDKRKNVESPYTFDLDNTIQRNANRFRNLGNDWRTL